MGGRWQVGRHRPPPGSSELKPDRQPAQEPDNGVVLALRPLAAADVPPVTRIVRSLPYYFTSDVPGQVARDTADHDGWVLTDSGEVVGFAVAARKSPGGR